MAIVDTDLFKGVLLFVLDDLHKNNFMTYRTVLACDKNNHVCCLVHFSVLLLFFGYRYLYALVYVSTVLISGSTVFSSSLLFVTYVTMFMLVRKNFPDSTNTCLSFVNPVSTGSSSH